MIVVSTSRRISVTVGHATKSATMEKCVRMVNANVPPRPKSAQAHVCTPMEIATTAVIVEFNALPPKFV